MEVDTSMPQPISLEFIKNKWPLTNVRLGNILQSNDDGQRHTRTIESAEGRYVYKIAGSWKTRESLTRDLGAFDFLKSVGFKAIPNLLKTKTGVTFASDGEKHVYLMEFVEGIRPPDTPQTWERVGLLTAEVHKIKDFPFHTGFQPQGILQDLKGRPTPTYSFAKEYLSLLGKMPSFDNLPQVLIHSELAPHNTIQKPKGNLVAIDWDEVGMGSRLIDIAEPLIFRFVTGNTDTGFALRENEARAYYRAYFSQQSLTEREKEIFFDVAVLMACFYIGYDPQVRWARIQWALKNRAQLDALVRSYAT